MDVMIVDKVLEHHDNLEVYKTEETINSKNVTGLRGNINDIMALIAIAAHKFNAKDHKDLVNAVARANFRYFSHDIMMY